MAALKSREEVNALTETFFSRLVSVVLLLLLSMEGEGKICSCRVD